MNIVYFVCHDLGRCLGCYGEPVSSPRLDAFAAESVRFTRAHCAAPACSPSRACAMSGLYPHRSGGLGLSHMGWPLPLSVSTSVDDFNAAGYQTILSGVNHERHPRTDRYQVDMTLHWDDWQSDRAVANALTALDRRDPARPFYLNIGTQEPHPSTWISVGTRIPPLPAARADWLPSGMPHTPQLESAFRDKLIPAIAFMDAAFGRLIDGLSARGLLDDTLVIFTTDHGVSGPRAKGTLHGRGTEIALLIRLPGGVHGGETREQLVTNLDYRSTWCAAANLPAPAGVDGNSFWELIEKAGAPGRDHLFLSRNFHGELPFRVEKDYVDLYNPKRAVRTSTRLYVRNYAPFSQPRQPPPAECVPLPEETTADWGASWELPGGPMDPEELYDLRGDPDETINLATHPDQQAVLRELRKLLDHDMRTSGDFLPTGLPPPRPESPGWGANWPITPIAR